MRGVLPRVIVYAGAATQCVILGTGLTLLALFDIELVWAIFIISHAQLLALLVHCWVTIQQLRRRTFFLWTSFVSAITLLSVVSLIVGLSVSDWPVPVFSAQCILALMDAVGALFRHRCTNKPDAAADDVGLFTRLSNMSPFQGHPLESLPSLPENRSAVSPTPSKQSLLEMLMVGWLVV